MPEVNEVAKALHEGLDHLREKGLTKGRLVDDSTGAVCARGAMLLASPTNYFGRCRSGLTDKGLALLAVIAVEQFSDRIEYVDRDNPHQVVIAVNDHDDTTQEDVERMFEKAIVLAYEQV